MQPRVATLADVPALVALIESAYRGEASRAGWTTEADLLGGQRIDGEMLGAIIDDPTQHLLLFQEDGAPIACANVERLGDTATIGLVSVRPDAQAMGWGKRLLEAAERSAIVQFGVSRIQMSVISQRPELIAWYERHGYVPTGETKPFPYGDARFGQPKRDDLQFVILESDCGQPRANSKEHACPDH